MTKTPTLCLLLGSFALLGSLAVAGCYRSPIGLPLPESTRFQNDWKRYGRLQPNKAIAIAGDMSGMYVTGYAFGHATELAAIEAAMVACEARRTDRRIEAPCRMYAIGDRAAETASSGSTLVR